MRRHSACDSSSKGTLLKTPALLTTASSRPNVSTAVRTIASPPSGLATDSYDATATPPARSISSTTWSATRRSTPSPCIVPPRSFTTTDPPRRAISIAKRRPRPRPAPVTIATWPSKSIMPAPWLPEHDHAAVDDEHLPGHHVAILRGEEHRRAGEILRLERTLQGREHGQHRHHVFGHDALRGLGE